MTRSMLIIFGVCFALGVYTGFAFGATTYNGHRVTATLVGGIDASPCTNPYGCAKGIVELRYNGRHTDHLVRCPAPKNLHVAGVTQTRRGPRVDVFACSRHYRWRLP